MKPTKRQNLAFQRAVFLLAVVLICAVQAAPVSAHALFLRSTPAANAILDSSPALVELFFSEALESGLSSVTVLDSNAQVVDQRDVAIDADNPTRMTVSLRSLVDGVYTVSWKAVSATDGHLTSGSYPFAVGSTQAAALSSVQPEQKQISVSTGDVLIQWLLVVVLALLAGKKPFQALIWRPALSSADQGESRGADPPAWKALTVFSLLGLFVLLGADLLVQASQIAGGGTSTIFAAEVGRILLESRLGLIWLMRLALALLCGWIVFSPTQPWKGWSLSGVALLLIATLSLTSHSAAEPHPTLPVLADWLHRVAISIWIGGLFYFVPAVRQIRRGGGVAQTGLTSRLIIRFSTLALICVGLTGLTGIYSAILRVGSFSALFNNLYGQALILKLALAALLVLLGALNLLVVSPRLKRARLLGAENLALVRRFARVILAEVILGVLVILCASVLAALPPVVATATTTDQVNNLQVDDLQEVLTISPGRVGLNTFTLQLQAGGQPLALAKEVLLRFSAIQQSLPPSEIQLISQGNGVYQAKGSYLSLPGSWQVQAIVRRENKFDAYANLNLVIQNPNAGSAASENQQFAGACLIIVGLGYAFLILALTRSPTLRLGLGGAPAAMLLVLGIFYLTLPLPSNQGLVNPIPPNPASVNAGQALYVQRCAACHGATGKGDGPTGILMNPRPADLTQHAVAGVHSDAQLFQWISQGYPGTQMPAFQSIFSETERWNLVNFVRSLAPR